MQFSVLDLWNASGPAGRTIVVALLALSIVSLSVGIERWLVLRRAAAGSARFLAAWRTSAEARSAGDAPGSDSPAAVLLRTLGGVLDSNLSPEATERAYDRTVHRLLLSLGESLRRGLGLLATVGSTAPFIGLFGTVMGIVNAFGQMAATGQGGLATVSAGIAEALVTTALGILAAIPALWLYNALSGRIASLLTELECAAEELAVEHLGIEPAPARSRGAAGAGAHAIRRASVSRGGGD